MFLSLQVFCQFQSRFDVDGLTGFVTTRQEDHDFQPLLNKVHTGPKSMRNSDTPSPTGLTSPGLPIAKRATLTKIRARPWTSRKPSIQAA
jgi:hypothetical protein